MAAIVAGYRSQDSWSLATVHANHDVDMDARARTEAAMSPSNGPRHYPGRSEADQLMTRPRLPSISNFLQGAGPGHAAPSGQPSHSNLQQRTTPYPPALPPVQPVSTPPASQNPWSPKDDIRQKLQLDQRPPYHVRRASDSQYDMYDYRTRAHAILKHATGSEVHLPLYANQPFATPPPHPVSKRVLREDIIPGKGLCYVYDDGSICQKTINGDPVNPKWGTTKAGKPRKRLGQACNTCREKKIKCDPAIPKCTQCQKFNRECKFDAAPRSQPRSPKLRSAVTSPSEPYSMDEASAYRRYSSSHTDAAGSDSGRGVSPPRSYPDIDQNALSYRPGPSTKAEPPVTPPKRPCPTDSALAYVPESNKKATDRSRDDSPSLETQYALTRDPYTVDKRTVTTYLDIFFSHSMALKHHLVPQAHFMRWLDQHQNKPPASILVIYVMLAWGCILESNSESNRYGKIFGEIALEGVMQPADQFTLPLIQARVIFCLHQFQVGHFERAWDLCGAALRAACAIGLNSEDGILARCHEGEAVYGLDHARLAESLRRTFWSIFQLDRFGMSCLGYGTSFNKANICLRLPCNDSAFATGIIPQCPLYDGEEGLLESAADDMSAPNWTLVRRMQAASLLCDAQSLAAWSKLQVIASQPERVALKRRNLEQRLLRWNNQYTPLLQSTAGHATNCDGQIFGGLHILYHHASMVLHRHVHHSHLTSSEVAHHIKSAHHHAIRTLEIAQQLVSHGNQKIYDYNIAADDPITGHAILMAIDIITATGLNIDILENQSRLMGLILPGIELIDRLAQRWTSAKQQQALVSTRIQSLLTSAKNGVAVGKVAFFITEAMVTTHNLDNDVIYGGDRLRYLNALGLGSGVNHQSDIIKVALK